MNTKHEIIPIFRALHSLGAWYHMDTKELVNGFKAQDITRWKA